MRFLRWRGGVSCTARKTASLLHTSLTGQRWTPVKSLHRFRCVCAFQTPPIPPQKFSLLGQVLWQTQTNEPAVGSTFKSLRQEICKTALLVSSWANIFYFTRRFESLSGETPLHAGRGITKHNGTHSWLTDCGIKTNKETNDKIYIYIYPGVRLKSSGEYIEMFSFPVRASLCPLGSDPVLILKNEAPHPRWCDAFSS